MRTFYKSVFRVPTLNDLYYTLVGNRNLKPEYTKQLDLGVTYEDRIFNIQLDAYYNRIEDRIVCLPLKGSYQWTMLNYGYTRCLGVDLSLNAHYKHHSLLFTATYQDDRNRTDHQEKPQNNKAKADSARLAQQQKEREESRRQEAQHHSVTQDNTDDVDLPPVDTRKKLNFSLNQQP